MTKLSIKEKKQQILEYEKSFADRLAHLVLEKPVPPIWMILIPVFFVFYAMKIMEYSAGLIEFPKHYLLSRRCALETAFAAVENGRAPDIDKLITEAETVPSESQPLFKEWITLLTDHYCNVLSAKGDTVAERIRNHYRDKTSYMIFINRLNSAENSFNNSLLPDVDGDQQDIHFIAERMKKSCTNLRREEVTAIFS